MKYLKNRNFLLLIFLALFSCNKSITAIMNSEDTRPVDIKVNINFSKVNIYRDSIQIVIQNNSNQTVRIRSPKCWENSIPFLKNLDKKIISPVKLRVNPKCLEEFISIAPESSYKIYYNYTLANIYPDLNQGTYIIYFLYRGQTKDAKGNRNNIKPVKSKIQQIYVKK